ncbi:hypothetical protein [Cohnella sp. 56]|uniref:hypothetical protein n=1 Tax=Cohnella sp. 56 TaxID=3113722 RepID=UPI0030EA01C5
MQENKIDVRKGFVASFSFSTIFFTFLWYRTVFRDFQLIIDTAILFETYRVYKQKNHPPKKVSPPNASPPGAGADRPSSRQTTGKTCKYAGFRSAGGHRTPKPATVQALTGRNEPPPSGAGAERHSSRQTTGKTRKYAGFRHAGGHRIPKPANLQALDTPPVHTPQNLQICRL